MKPSIKDLPTLAEQLVSVQPMTASIGENVFKFRYKTGPRKGDRSWQSVHSFIEGFGYYKNEKYVYIDDIENILKLKIPSNFFSRKRRVQNKFLNRCYKAIKT